LILERRASVEVAHRFAVPRGGATGVIGHRLPVAVDWRREILHY